MADKISEEESETSLDSSSEEFEINESEYDSDSDESDCEPEKTPSQPSEYLLSRDGKIKWSRTSYNHDQKSNESIIAEPGPTAFAISGAKDIKSTFLLFFPPVIMNKILEMTNLEGARIFNEQWENISEVDLHCYFGLIILAGVFRHSLWSENMRIPLLRAIMPFERFRMISKAFRFDDKTTLAERRMKDKLAPIREIWDLWVALLPKFYNPSKNIVIDEKLLEFKGKCPFGVGVPSKRGKVKIRIWVACDCRSGYTRAMKIETGEEDAGEKQQIVLDLSKGLNGHNITCGEAFTSYALGQALLKKNITMVGMIKKKKPEVPRGILFHKKVRGSMFGFTDDTTIVSYIPQKYEMFVLMSTLHKTAEIANGRDKKPQILHDFMKTEEAVCILEEQLSGQTFKRKTKRWPLVVFSKMMDISAYNASVLWQEINQDNYKNKRFKRWRFLKELGNQLVEQKLKEGCHQRKTNEAAEVSVKSEEEPGKNFVETYFKKKRRCYLCPENSNNTYKSYCSNCHKCVCEKHSAVICKHCGANICIHILQHSENPQEKYVPFTKTGRKNPTRTFNLKAKEKLFV